MNFVHDEVLIEVPARSNLAHQAAMIRNLMIRGMQEVVPDVRVDVECSVSDRWYKSARMLFDRQGRLIPWRPGLSADAADRDGPQGDGLEPSGGA